MTVRIYRSDDASAPVLTGQVGTFVNLLDAVLVNGYGSRTAAGWAIAFTGTNKRAYRAVSGNRFYLRVQDDGTIGSAAFALATGYEAMTGIDTGTGRFPRADQRADANAAWFKSNTADATVRPWVIVADERRLYVWIGVLTTGAAAIETAVNGIMEFFGDLIAYKSGDNYCSLISVGSNNNLSNHSFIAIGNQGADTQSEWFPRPWFQQGQPFLCGKIAGSPLAGGSTVLGGNTAPPYPDPVSGGINLHPVEVIDNTNSLRVIRGRLPGIWNPLHNLPGSSGDTFNGTGALAGRTFMLLSTQGNSTSGRVAMETSDTWLT